MSNFDTEIKEVKAIRVECALRMKQVEQLRRTPEAPGRELSLAFTKLQEVRHWLGESLAIYGAQHPYPEADHPENAIVSPTADLPEVPK